MTVYRWPFDIEPSRQSWSIVSRAAVSQSPISAHSQTVSRGGSFWRCDMSFNNLDSLTRDRLLGYLDLIADQADLIYIPDFSAGRAGSTVDTGSLIQNGEILSTTGWTTTDAALYLEDGWLGVRGTSLVNPGQVHQEITTYSASARYCLTANVRNGDNATTTVCKVGTTLGGSELALKSSIVDGGYDPVYFDAPASGSIYVTYSHNTFGQERLLYLSSVVLTPVFQIDGASTSGSRVRVKGLLDHGAAGHALSAGETITITTGGKQEFKRLSLPLRAMFVGMNEEGLAYIQPPTRGTVAADDEVDTGQNALCRMRLATPGYSRADSPGVFSDISVSFVEAFQ